MLPSLDTVVMCPVSAQARLHPEMPMSAARNFSRRAFLADPGQAGRIVRVVNSKLFGKQTPHILFGFVNGRGNDVGRCFIGQLNDVLPQIGLQGFDAGIGQSVVQANLLRNHGFAFDHPLDLVFRSHFQAVGHGFFCILGKINMAAVFAHIAGQLLQQAVQVLDGIHAYVMGHMPQVGPFGQAVDRPGPFPGRNGPAGRQGLLQHRIFSSLPCWP